MSVQPSSQPAPSDRLSESTELLAIRKDILQIVLVIASLVGTVTYFSNIFNQIRDQSWVIAGAQTIAYAMVLAVTVIPKLPYNVRLHTLLTILMLLSLSDLAESGLVGEGRLFLMAFTILAILLLPFRIGMRLFAVSVVAVGGIAALMILGILPAPTGNAVDDSSAVAPWLTGGLIYVTLTLLLMSATIQLVRRLEAYMIQQKQLTTDLERERVSLETRVKERTVVLEKQAARMEISSRFMQETAHFTDQYTLLEYAQYFFHEHFNIHNLLIGLNDAKGEFWLPVAATGSLAEAYRDQAQKIRLRQPGTLGDLIAKGSARLVVNQNEEALYFRSSALGDIHSLVVLPLQVNEKQVGAILLFNSADRGTVGEDIQLYQTLAGQLAIGLEKSNLLSEMRRTVEELKASSQQQTQRGWRTYLRHAGQARNYRYDREKIEHVAAHSETAGLAVQQGRVIVTTQPGDGSGQKASTTVAIPILLRDQPVGVVDLRFEGDAVPKDMVALVEATTKRLAVALENARLMEEARGRAEREHIVSGIGSKIRSHSDIDNILKTAATEIGRSLGVAEVLVQLRGEHSA